MYSDWFFIDPHNWYDSSLFYSKHHRNFFCQSRAYYEFSQPTVFSIWAWTRFDHKAWLCSRCCVDVDVSSAVYVLLSQQHSVYLNENHFVDRYGAKWHWHLIPEYEFQRSIIRICLLNTYKYIKNKITLHFY